MLLLWRHLLFQFPSLFRALFSIFHSNKEKIEQIFAPDVPFCHEAAALFGKRPMFNHGQGQPKKVMIAYFGLDLKHPPPSARRLRSHSSGQVTTNLI
jgi:hypothetical protein